MKALANAVLLDARLDVARAREKILRSDLDRVAVRRTEGLVVFWYAFSTVDVIEQFAGHGDSTAVKQALNLHAYTASPTHQLGSGGQAPSAADTIVIEGSRFVGILPLGATWNSGLTDTAAKPLPHPPHPPANISRALRRLRSLHSPRDLARHGQTAVPTPAEADSFMAYPKLDTLPTVVPGQAFTVRIGLGAQAQTGTVGGALDIALPAGSNRFDLDVMLIAEGFGMPAGSRHRLPVERANPDAHSVEVSLVAPDIVGEPLLSTLSVIYFFASMPCGYAARRIAVIPAEQQPLCDTHGSGTLWIGDTPATGNVRIQPGTSAADLTVIISKPDGNPAGGQYVWSFASPHPVHLPAQPIIANLGTDARDLGSRIIEGVQKAEGLDMVALKMGGLGRNVAEKFPAEFWTLLREVAEGVGAATPGRRPTVMLLTAEAHVPWELARMAVPLDDNDPPYLGCQVDISRWPLNDSGNPGVLPAAGIDVRQLAVVVGDYAARSGWRKLENAEKEGDTLVNRHHAIRLPAAAKEIKQLLNARLPDGKTIRGAEAVHFACHGEALGGHPLDAAVILEDGQHLDPEYLTASPLGEKHHPFLFLNACQVGKSGESLGSFSGFAGESLKGGFHGFLAPLWSVDDAIAHDIAVEFYERAFGAAGKPPEPVAAVLRDLRRRFDPDQEKNSSTRLAYVFYGHPGLILHRIEEN